MRCTMDLPTLQMIEKSELHRDDTRQMVDIEVEASQRRELIKNRRNGALEIVIVKVEASKRGKLGDRTRYDTRKTSPLKANVCHSSL